MNGHGLRMLAGDLGRVESLRELGVLLRGKLPFLLPRLLGVVAVRRRAPLALQIEPTNACNLQCVCCARKGMRRPVGYMEMGLFRKIVADAAQAGARLIHLYLHGEPTLHPAFADMVACVKSRGLALTVATNGMTFDAALGRALYAAGVDGTDRFIFSMLGHTRETHEAVMRGVDHDRVVANLEGFLRLRRERHRRAPLIELDYFVMPENHAEAEAFRRHWSGRVDRVTVCGIARQFAGGAVGTRTRTCKYIWERVTCFHTGEVTPCVADVQGSRPCGDLRTQSVREVWHGAALQALRAQHRARRFEQCGLCARCDW